MVYRREEVIRADLIRRSKNSQCTLGVLVIGTDAFATLEPPWKDNQANISCIKDGTYECVFLPRSASGKYRNVWHVRDVEGRSGILMHNGNLVSHTKGCILLGTHHGTLAGQPAVLGSRKAMRDLYRLVGEEPISLTIW